MLLTVRADMKIDGGIARLNDGPLKTSDGSHALD